MRVPERNYAPCKLDEVAVWSRALSASEMAKVSTIYSQATTRRSRSPTTELLPAGGISMANNEGLYHLDAAISTILLAMVATGRQLVGSPRLREESAPMLVR